MGIAIHFNVCGFKVIIWSSAWIGTDLPTTTAVPSMMSSAAIRFDRMVIAVPYQALLRSSALWKRTPSLCRLMLPGTYEPRATTETGSTRQYSSNSCSGVCGHYTQIVWRSTTEVGCGLRVCTTGSPFDSHPGATWTMVVCDYRPPGNFRGQRPY